MWNSGIDAVLFAEQEFLPREDLATTGFCGLPGAGVLAIVQARMSSRRLPGKVLHPLAGKPLLQWVYIRLAQATSVSRIVVSTSDAASDEPIAEFCRAQGISLHRGDLEDVAGRFLACAHQEGADLFVRVSGDSPLIDPFLVDAGIRLASRQPCDLATNVQVRSFPKGQSVEVIRSQALERAWMSMDDPEDREHVTRYFYSHPSDFEIRNFSSRERMGEIQLSVDTPNDLWVVGSMLEQLEDGFSWRAAAELRVELSQ